MNEFNDRKLAASQARRYCAGDLSAIEFHGQFWETTDRDIDELVYLIDHEGPDTGLFARSYKRGITERTEIESLVQRLERTNSQ
jgi:hypothetical protein